jgi:hypothetical protein
MKSVIYKEYSHYLVDERGNVYSTRGGRGLYSKGPKLIKSFPNKNTKYRQVVLQNKALGLKPKVFYVHRLVAGAYIPNPNNLPEVNHKDFNRGNNNLDNLEWVTRSENAQHKIQNIDKSGEKLYDLINNLELVNKGIEHYNEYKDYEYLKELWDYCSPRAILNKFGVKYTRFDIPNNKLDKLIQIIKSNPNIDTKTKTLDKIRKNIGFNFRYDTFKIIKKNVLKLY